MRVHSVARLAGVTVTDAVRQDNVVLGRIQQLPRSVELSGESLTEELCPRSTGPVHYQYGVANNARSILDRSADSPVMNIQFLQHLAVFEMKIVNDEIAFDWRGIILTKRND